MVIISIKLLCGGEEKCEVVVGNGLVDVLY